MAYRNPILATHISEWSASCYDDQQKKWVYGILSVSASSLLFDPSNKPLETTVHMPFNNIVDVRKATTGLVFGAIVIALELDRKVWLSSLYDREEVFRTIEHFRHAYLLSERKAGSQDKQRQRGKSVMGQKLLNIVQDSQDTLAGAANTLHAQGRQIDGMLDTMEDLHSDLDIADRLVQDIDSWLGRWFVPSNVQTLDPVIVNRSDCPGVFDFEVLYNKLENNRSHSKQIGTLQLTKEGVTLFTSKMKKEQWYKWLDVSQIRVVTPWEIKLIRSHIGKPDLVYSIVSAQMVGILKLFDNCVPYKLKYESIPDHVKGFHDRVEAEKRFCTRKCF